MCTPLQVPVDILVMITAGAQPAFINFPAETMTARPGFPVEVPILFPEIAIIFV